MKKLSDFGHNVHSQFGEDGIIEKVFQILGTASKRCIEFGAWDGFHLSNTANLWTKGWAGVLIEANSAKYQELVKNVQPYNCRCILARVGFAPENRLETILQNHQIPREADLLSIDIDGDDYYVFESLKAIRPRLIICEYNPTIPPDMELVAERGNYFGCSALSLSNLAQRQGYQLIAMTDTNCFFVQKEDYPKFSEFDTQLESVAPKKYLISFISGFDGQYVLSQQPIFGYGKPSRQKLHGAVYHPPFINLRILKLWLFTPISEIWAGIRCSCQYVLKNTIARLTQPRRKKDRPS